MDKFHYDKLLEERRGWYKTIGKVHCPCLGVEVAFNSRGFRHVLYDGEGRPRSLQDRIRRLSLLPLVIPMIKHAKKIHEHRVEKGVEFISFRKYNFERETWVTVVIKKTLSGNTTYLSIMDRK
jgi:hypothetical protein